jgi:hypothetical protein
MEEIQVVVNEKDLAMVTATGKVEDKVMEMVVDAVEDTEPTAIANVQSVVLKFLTSKE